MNRQRDTELRAGGMLKCTGAKSSLRCLKHSKLSDTLGAEGYVVGGSGGDIVWRVGAWPEEEGSRAQRRRGWRGKQGLGQVGKTARPFRHDLNQIPYDYTVDVTNRFKELDLMYRVPEELWTEVHNIVSGGGDQNHPQEKQTQKGKTVVLGDLTNS